jgi:hypothetical protein
MTKYGSTPQKQQPADYKFIPHTFAQAERVEITLTDSTVTAGQVAASSSYGILVDVATPARRRVFWPWHMIAEVELP